jgi:hypothetical protein
MTDQSALPAAAFDPDDIYPALETLMAAWMEGIVEVIDETGGAFYISQIAVDLPIEFQIHEADGELSLHASPPTQLTETTILPVWHRLRATYQLAGD